MTVTKAMIFHLIMHEVKSCNDNNSPGGDFILNILSTDNNVEGFEFYYARYNDPEHTGSKYYARNKDLDIIRTKIYSFDEIVDMIDSDISQERKSEKTTYRFILENRCHSFVRNVFYELYHSAYETYKAQQN